MPTIVNNAGRVWPYTAEGTQNAKAYASCRCQAIGWRFVGCEHQVRLRGERFMALFVLDAIWKRNIKILP